MAELGIREEDIEEKFIRSQGKGGQNVNKLETCVYLEHRPTGIEVKCQQERYQAMNRFLARRILTNKIESLVLGEKIERGASADRKNPASERRRSRRASRRRCSRTSTAAPTSSAAVRSGRKRAEVLPGRDLAGSFPDSESPFHRGAGTGWPTAKIE